MKYIVRSLLVLSLVVLMGQGCNPFGGAQQQMSEDFVEGVVEQKTGVRMELESGKLPEHFPEDVPRYPGAEYVSSVVTNEGKIAIANFRTEDAPELVHAWFKTELEGSGFTLDTVFQAGASIQLYKKDTVKITVQTQADPEEGGTAVSIQRAES